MRTNAGVSYLLTLVAAFVLQFLPLPYLLGALRVLWVPLTIAAWCVAGRSRSGVFGAFVCGLLLDAAYGTALGQNALALTLVAYAALHLRNAVSVLAPLQSALALTPVWVGYTLLQVWMDGLHEQAVDPWLRGVPLVTTTLIWPLAVALVRELDSRARAH